MKIALAIGVLVLYGGAGAADQRILDDEQAKLLDEARRAALTQELRAASEIARPSHTESINSSLLTIR